MASGESSAPSREAMPRPLTDAFGTRLEPHDLLAGLAAAGLPAARLVVREREVVLECDDPHPWRDEVARALTWLRARLSPLVPVRAAPRSAPAPGFADERRVAIDTVALLEAVPKVDARVDRLNAIPGAPSSGYIEQPGCPFAPRCAFAVPQCSVAKPPLVTVKPGHTAECWRAQEVYAGAARPVANASARPGA